MKPHLYILDQNGNPIPCEDVLKWGESMENSRTLERTIIGEVTVSTVFLGINHSYSDGPPILWETMIFGGEHDQYQDRYSSKEEALEGHKKAVNMVADEL